MSSTALEAFINERISINMTISSKRIAMNLQDSKDEKQIYTDENQKKVLEMLKEQDVITKYRMIPILLWQKAFDEGRSPFQDFVTLVGIRNDIIHYKMPFYGKEDKRPKWVNRLEEKSVFLAEPVSHEGSRVWIDEICTLKGAKWAYNTSCRMIRKFVELSEGITEITCHPWSDSLIEI